MLIMKIFRLKAAQIPALTEHATTLHPPRTYSFPYNSPRTNNLPSFHF